MVVIMKFTLLLLLLLCIVSASAYRLLCHDGTPMPHCNNPCHGSYCAAYPNARCVPDYCGGCYAKFFNEYGARVYCHQSRNHFRDRYYQRYYDYY